jgi:hypothetical protein
MATSKCGCCGGQSDGAWCLCGCVCNGCDTCLKRGKPNVEASVRAIDRTHAKSGKQVKELQKTVAAARLSG